MTLYLKETSRKHKRILCSGGGGRKTDLSQAKKKNGATLKYRQDHSPKKSKTNISKTIGHMFSKPELHYEQTQPHSTVN